MLWRTKPKLVINKVKKFEVFEKWILSPDGGKKDAGPAALVLRQVETILSMIGTQTVESLFDKELIPDKFYPESRALHKAATTISYLHSPASFILSLQQRTTLGFPKDVKKWQKPSLKNVGSGVKVFAKRLKRDFGRKKRKILHVLLPQKKFKSLLVIK